jgi:hypothetical protein
MVEKFKTEIKDLQNELDTKTNFNLEQAKDSSDKVFSLESQLQKKNSILSSL